MTNLPYPGEPKGKYAYFDSLENYSALGRPQIPKKNKKLDKEFVKEVPQYGKYYRREKVKNTLRNITAITVGAASGLAVWRWTYQPISGAVALGLGTVSSGLFAENFFRVCLGLHSVNMKEVNRARDWFHYLRYKEQGGAPGIHTGPLYTKEELEKILQDYRKENTKPQGLYESLGH
eukprot:gb/GECH01003490.1/.p1 GENE.gb/GECH01003490.1/~~gb/GECH01003490.1/.p1  ORF type:complete len:177 (+),score=28.58 gb/GECH01003490.1/:1-531(+)